MATRRTKTDDADKAEATEQVASAKKAADTKTTAEPTDRADEPVKRPARGKKADEAKPTDKSVAAEPAKKTARGKKAADEPVVTAPVVEAAPAAAEPAKKPARGKKADAEKADKTAPDAVVEVAAPVAAEAAPKKKGRGKKAVDAPKVAEPAVEATPAAQAPKKTGHDGEGDADKLAAPAAAEATPAVAEAAPAQAEQAAEAKQDDPRERREREPAREVAPEAMLEEGRVWLQGFFERMSLTSRIVATFDAATKTLLYDLQGDGGKHLLGASGQSPRGLEALQTVLREVLPADRAGLRIHVDVGRFRLQRAERLRELARRLSQAVSKVGAAITVAGMNDFERRIIHQALEHHEKVRTESHGTGTFRKLRVEPR